MSRETFSCDHACHIHQPGTVTRETHGAVDSSPAGRKRAYQRMSPANRKIWDDLTESVRQFKRRQSP